MKKNKFWKLILTMFFFHSFSISQTTFELYQDDSLSIYFKELSLTNGANYYNAKMLKDSLPDGNYIFYYGKRGKKFGKKRIMIECRYVNGKKNGSFNYYSYEKHKMEPYYCHESQFFKGVQIGAEKEYKIINKCIIMMYYCHYSENGLRKLELYFYQGKPNQIIKYEQGIQVYQDWVIW